MVLTGQTCLKYSAVCGSIYDNDECFYGKSMGTWAYLETLIIFPAIEKASREEAQEGNVGENRPFDSEHSLAAFGGVNRDVPVSHCSYTEMCWYLLILISAEKHKQKIEYGFGVL